MALIEGVGLRLKPQLTGWIFTGYKSSFNVLECGDQRYAPVLPVCLNASTRGLGSTHVHQLFGFKLQVFESRIDA